MNRKIVYVFISLIFVCLLSMSIVCAADNSTSTSDSSTDDLNDDAATEIDSNIKTGTLDDFKNDLVASDCNISLSRNYELIIGPDSKYVGTGIVLNNTEVFIEGNNHTINMNSLSRLFTAFDSNITINNLNIRNTKGNAIQVLNSNLITNHVSFESNEIVDSNAVLAIGSFYNSTSDSFTNLKNDFGSAIQVVSNSELSVVNATFNIPKMQKWGCIYVLNSEAAVINTIFSDMKSKYATAIYDTNSTLVVSNCTFINLNANETAGAIGIKDIEKSVILINGCKFINVSSIKNGGALFVDINGMFGIKEGRVVVHNSIFEDCGSNFGGAILQLGGSLLIVNSSLSDNYAIINGGAVYTSNADLSVINSTLKNNIANVGIEDYNQGGAIYFDKGDLNIVNSRFEDNDALEGTDVYLYDANYEISNSYFTGNLSSMFDEDSELENNTFLKENNFNDTEYIYVYDSNGSSINYNPIIFDESLVNATSFDLRDYGLVTPVKDQGDMGSCWTFGVTGALESAYLKASNKTVVLDISESNIQDSGLMYYMFGMEDSTEGSLRTVGTSYMLSWLGVTTSDDNTYDELGKISPIFDNGTKYHIHNVVFLMPRQNITDNQKFKDALVKYGAVGVSVHGASKEDSLNEDTNAAYFYNETFGYGTDHSVTLVGWNDSYSRDNFASTPPGDGAWIIKNSWGSAWGDKGYYYVSYYDTAFGTSKLPVAFILDNNHNYEKNYQYDIISNVDFNIYKQNVSYANKFTSIGKDLIAAVGTYFNDSGVDYKIEIYVNDKLAYTQTGVSKYLGFETIKLDKYVGIRENDTFVVDISAGAIAPISEGSRQHYLKNTSFIGLNNIYEDLYNDDQIACVKAYTIPDNSYMTIEHDQNIVQVKYFDENGNPLTNTDVSVIANDYEYTATTDENGVALFKLNLPGGKHTVTVINPISGEKENITITIPSDYIKPVNNYNNVKNVKVAKTLQKTYKVSVKDKIVYEGRYFTIQSLNDIFGQNFINGHLVVYLDGKVVFNGTVSDDLSTIIFEIIDSLLGNHELKVEFTVGNDTQTYTENITIS